MGTILKEEGSDPCKITEGASKTSKIKEQSKGNAGKPEGTTENIGKPRRGGAVISQGLPPPLASSP